MPKKIALILLAAACSGCALVSPTPQAVAQAARCPVSAIEYTDEFDSRFGGIINRSSRRVRVECDK